MPPTQLDLLFGRLEPFVALVALAVVLVAVPFALRRGQARDLRSPAVISSVLVLPFMLLELVNRRGFHEAFPVPLFAILWLLPFSFNLTGKPIVREIRDQERIKANPIRFLVGAIFMILVASLWVVLLQDQMPCFLGVPNCD